MTRQQKMYAIRNPLTELVKVGLAVEPVQRMRELETGAGTALELLYTVEVKHPRAAEAFVHNALIEYHAFREWFALKNTSLLPKLFEEAATVSGVVKEKKARGESSSKVVAQAITCARVAMAQRNWSGADLARETGLSRQSVSQALCGKTDLLSNSWFKVLDTLGLHLELVPINRETKDAA